MCSEWCRCGCVSPHRSRRKALARHLPREPSTHGRAYQSCFEVSLWRGSKPGCFRQVHRLPPCARLNIRKALPTCGRVTPGQKEARGGRHQSQLSVKSQQDVDRLNQRTTIQTHEKWQHHMLNFKDECSCEESGPRHKKWKSSFSPACRRPAGPISGTSCRRKRSQYALVWRHLCCRWCSLMWRYLSPT